MKRKPRSSNEGIFAGGMGFDCAYQGIMLAGVTLVSYFVGHYLESGRWEVVDSLDGMTMAFITLAMAEIFHSFNMRTQHASIFSVQGHNVYLYGSMVFSWYSAPVSFICRLSPICSNSSISPLKNT